MVKDTALINSHDELNLSKLKTQTQLEKLSSIDLISNSNIFRICSVRKS